MHLYKYPVYKNFEFYQKVIDKVVSKISEENGAVSIYQMGSVSDPGISDLDIIATFKDDFTMYSNPLKYLNNDESYLFAHSVFGISESDFIKNLNYSSNHNYKLLWGKQLINKTLIKNEILERQIALEFILINIIARAIEKRYKLLSVRNILLSVKAIYYDLCFLNFDKEEPLTQNVLKLLNFRKTWFDKKISDKEFIAWYNSFYDSLIEGAKRIFNNYNLEFPEYKDYQFSRNAAVSPGNEFDIFSKGLSLPPFITSINKKLRNFNGVFNSFLFKVPVKKENDNFLVERFNFYNNMLKKNKSNLPNFAPLSNPFLTKVCI